MKGFYHFIAVVFTLFLTVDTYAQSNFRSRTDGPWNSPSTWERDVNGDGFGGADDEAISTAAPTLSSGTITIRNGDIVTVSSPTSIDQTTVENGGVLRVAVTITLTVSKNSGHDLTISDGGTLQLMDDGGFNGSTFRSDGYVWNAGDFTYTLGISAVTFGTGSTYEHARDGGSIPVATWNPGSLIKVTGVISSTPANTNQNFASFTWDCSGQDGLVRNLAFTGTKQFNGDFSILNTGIGSIAFSNTNTSLTVNGNFIVSGSSAFVLTASAVVSLTITQNYINTSSSGNPSRLAILEAGNGVINVKGDFTQSSGVLQGNVDGMGAPVLQSGVFFNGTSTQDFISGGDFDAVNFTVRNGATLNFASENAVSGTGNFTVETGGKILVGSKDPEGAIQDVALGGTGGNILVSGTRTFNSSTIVYDGNSGNGNSAGAQTIGNGQPSGTGIVTRIDNPSGVSLSASLVIVGTLILDNGNLSIGQNTLTLNGNFTPNSNALVTTTSSNLGIGGTGSVSLAITGSTIIHSLVLNRSGDVTLENDITIGTNTSGNFTIDATNLILNGHTLTVRKDFDQLNGGTITADAASSLVIDGSGALPTSVSLSGSAISSLEMNRGTTTLSLAANITATTLRLTRGTLENTGAMIIASGGTIIRSSGLLTGNAPGAVDSYNVTYANTSNIDTDIELPTGATELSNLTTGASQVTLKNPITVNGVFTVGGPFISSGKAIEIKGNLVSNSAPTFTSSTVTFSGTTTMSGNATPVFGNVEIDGTVTANANIRINGNLVNDGTLTSGTNSTTTFGGTTTISGSGSTSFHHVSISGSSALTAPNTMNVGGNFVVSGTFMPNSGTVVFNGTTTITGTPTFANVTVSGTLNAPTLLTIGGNLAINGTFNAGSSSNVVLFSGSINQTLDRTSGSAATVDLNNITINKTGGIFSIASTVSGTIFRLNGVFTVQSNVSGVDVDFDGPGTATNATFLLRSTASATARIAPITSGATTQGRLSVERYIKNDSQIYAWRSLASPVEGATVADWKQSIPVIGRFADPTNDPSYVDIHEPSIYLYQENLGGGVDDRWVPYPNDATYTQPASSFGLDNGRGYSVFVLDKGEPTITVRGTLRVGDKVVNVTSTGSAPDAGYNLIGNPYPSPVNWNSVTRSGSVSPIIVLKDNVGNGGLSDGSYLYYDADNPGQGTSGNFNGILASGQAFFAQANGTGIVTFTEASKSTASNSTVIRASYASWMKIRVDGNGLADETIVRLREAATEGYDFGMDAAKLANDYVDLYTFFDGESGPLAINSFGKIDCSETINVGLRKVTQGSHVFTFSDMETFTQDYNVLLIDNFTGQSVDLGTKSSYRFEVTTDTLSYGSNRFKLVIMQPGINTALTVIGDDVCAGSQAKLDLENSETNVEYFAAINGDRVTENFAGNGSALSVFIPAEKLTAGGQIVMLMAQRPGCDPVPMAQTVDLTVHEIMTPSVVSASSCGSGSVSLSAGGADDEGTYRWYETETDVDPISGASGSEFVTPTLDKSKTYYVTIANALGCEGERVAVKAEVVNVEPVSIEVLADNTLKSSYQGGNQWYLNGEALDGAVGQTYLPDGPGLYSVQVSTGSCTTSAEFLVTGTESEGNAGVHVYPNPAIDIITVELPAGKPAEVSVFDLLGRKLGNVPMSDDGKHNTGVFDLRSNDSGVYFVKVLRGKVLRNYKIIKE